MPPSVNFNATFETKKEQLHAYIYDSNTGRQFDMNISESVKTGKNNILLVNDSLPRFLFNIIVMDSTKNLIREMNDHSSPTHQERYIVQNGIKTNFPFFDELNQIGIKQDENINLLTAYIKYNDTKEYFVEAPIYRNHIIIYSLDGSFKRTICLDDELDTLIEIQNTNRKDRINQFSGLKIFNDFFGVVYINEDKYTYQTNRKKLPSVLFFDWGGNPLAKLQLSHFITSFDIDFANKELYTFDLYNDEFYKYDIEDIILNMK